VTTNGYFSYFCRNFVSFFIIFLAFLRFMTLIFEAKTTKQIVLCAFITVEHEAHPKQITNNL
jgi:hypothetical protein